MWHSITPIYISLRDALDGIPVIETHAQVWFYDNPVRLFQLSL